MKDKTLWVFKYEPNNLSNMVVSENKKSTLKKVYNDLPNTLLAGKPGTGKGTFMNILKNREDVECLKINASEKTGIDFIRENVFKFSKSFSPQVTKIVYFNECLDKDEEIKTPGGFLKLKDMEPGKEYDVFSVNKETLEVELDKAEKITEKEDDIYEVELEDGRTINCNMEHKFFIEDEEGKIKKIKLKDLNEGDEIISL